MKKIVSILILLTSQFFLEVFADVFDYPVNSFQVPEIQSRKCRFNQQKVFADSGITLISSGNFVFNKNKEIIFYTTKPLDSVSRYSINDSKDFGSIINSLATGNIKPLRNEFNIFYKKNKGIWSIGLKPKQNSKSSAFIDSIEMQGSEDINRIKIINTDKTVTELEFY